MRPLVVGVDASRNRSGGAKAHIIGIFEAGSPEHHGIGEVHLWAYKALLEAVPDEPWLIKHNPSAIESSLARQLWWQRFKLPRELREAGCHVAFNTDAGSISPFEPAVTLSQDMLSYEPGAMKRHGMGRAWLRLAVLRFVQNRSLKRATHSIFLTAYAARRIEAVSGPLQSVSIINHGISPRFVCTNRRRNWADERRPLIRCLYVSNVAPYKHQLEVVRAIAALRARGHDVELHLVGGGSGTAQRQLEQELVKVDPMGAFVRQPGRIVHDDLPSVLSEADLFIFASSCESMPNTLIEAMAVGLPIASSDRGPMPEILGDAGVYFDPELPESICAAVERLILDEPLRNHVSEAAKARAKQYSWRKCADETWGVLAQVARQANSPAKVLGKSSTSPL